jgi:hypothetical protein
MVLQAIVKNAHIRLKVKGRARCVETTLSLKEEKNTVAKNATAEVRMEITPNITGNIIQLK